MSGADELTEADHRGRTSAGDPNRRGQSGLGLSDPDRAVEGFDAALRIDPEDVLALSGRGRAWQVQGDHAKALRDLDEAVRLKPDDAEALGRRATARHHLGDFAGAVADFDRAITAAPRVAWLYNGRGRALHADDDDRAAVADYSQAIALDPDFADPHRNRGSRIFRRGRLRGGDRRLHRVDPAQPGGRLVLHPPWRGPVPNRGLRGRRRRLRPGRVDQAIEFTLPDEEGRTKLVRLYARGVEVPEAVVRATDADDRGNSLDLVIRAPDERDLGDAHGLDGSFVVESELVLFVEGGVVRYEVVPVPRHEKSYAGEDLSDRLDDPGKAVFLAYLDGSIAGRVVVSEGWNRYAWVEDIAVDARRREAGVGRALMGRAVAWAVGRGLAGVRAETQSDNVPACKFYESCGFHLGGFDRDLYRGLDEGTTEVALFWYRPVPSEAPPRIPPADRR